MIAIVTFHKLTVNVKITEELGGYLPSVKFEILFDETATKERRFQCNYSRIDESFYGKNITEVVNKIKKSLRADYSVVTIGIPEIRIIQDTPE